MMEALVTATGLTAQTLMLIALGTALLFGVLVGWLLGLPARQRLQRDRDRLANELMAEERVAQERQRAFEEAKEQLQQSFGNLSAEALKRNSEQFLHLAESHLKQKQSEAQSDLEKRQAAIKHMVDPIKEALDKTAEQVQRLEKERKEAYGSISKYLESMQLSQKELRLETHNLVKALRRPEVRGQWGEIQLKRLVELAGMLEHCDFDTQVTRRSEEGILRPDLVVHLPEERNIVIDAKTPLDSYLEAVETQDDAERRRHLAEHLRKVKDRIDELSRKAYWSQFDRSPEFVVLFLPGEQYLAAALDLDNGLLERALSQKVILATPTSLMGLLKAVSYSWRQLALIDNAEKIRDIGVQLYDRLATFTDHLSKLGRSLNTTVTHFNSAMGSLKSRVLPGAQKFHEMGITSHKDPEEPEQIEQQARDKE